jgi:hypothetical protein
MAIDAYGMPLHANMMVLNAFKARTYRITMGGSMFALAVIGTKNLSFEDVARAVAALEVVWHRGIKANIVVGREIQPEMCDTNHRFDYALYDIIIPVDIKGLVRNQRPVAIVEDSRDLARLRQREKRLSKDLEKLDIEVFYIHVVNIGTSKEDLIKQDVLKLSTMIYGNNWYRLGVSI